MSRLLPILCTVLAMPLMMVPSTAQEVPGYPFDGMVQIETEYDFDTLWDRTVQAIEDHDMLVLLRASASRGAAGRGIEIPANGVIDTFRNDFAVRILSESVPAGFEQPIRFYLTANDAGTTDLTYRLPSALYAPYGDPEVDAVAAELDEMFRSIAAQATGSDG
ncbi:MAG: DUF302 domain-containing protein [Pseudomonadota bacterium]